MYICHLAPPPPPPPGQDKLFEEHVRKEFAKQHSIVMAQKLPGYYGHPSYGGEF